MRAASDSQSLYLPSGSSATTPYVCVGLVDPRLAARGRQVDALIRTPLGVVSAPAGVAGGTSIWAPSLPMLLLANLTSPLDFGDGEAEVAFRFRPAGLLAAWQIDDVYVDPFRVR